MTAPGLRIVIVLYRCRLRQLRPLVDQIERLRLPTQVVLSVVINRDNHPTEPALRRRLAMAAGWIEIFVKDNATGVTGAYNHFIRQGAPDDLIVLLDADGVIPDEYLRAIWAHRDTLLSRLGFIGPELFAGNLRVSPYRLHRTVPVPIAGPVTTPLRFEDGFGVINSCLAGSVESFRTVNGFSERIALDLSDVAWSIAAAGRQAQLHVVGRQAHDLSMIASGFTWRRLGKYLLASWRLACRTRDPIGLIRLSLRGVLALRLMRRLRW
jgi:GT2 family glycosyltransferase